MEPKTMFNIFGSFSNFQPNMRANDEENAFSRTTYPTKRANCKLEDLQIFTDHLKLTDRFKRTLYYGKLPATECPSLPLTDMTLELFTKTVPNGGLDILDMHYASSVSRKACISPCSMILAMMYLDQLRLKNPEYLQNVSSCDLFLISMLVASKYLYDNGEEDEVFNVEWASSANIDVKELNILERQFLSALKWEIYVKPSAFFELLQDIECQIALREASKRGWFSYTDLWVLSQGSASFGILSMLIDNCIKVMAISAVAYIAAALTLLGASAISQKSIIPVKAVLQSVLLTGDIITYSFPLSISFAILSSSKTETSLLMTNELPSYMSNTLCTEKECPILAGNGTIQTVHHVSQKISSRVHIPNCATDQLNKNCLCDIKTKMIEMDVFVKEAINLRSRKAFHKTKDYCDRMIYDGRILVSALTDSKTWWLLNSKCKSQASSVFDMNYLFKSYQSFTEASLQA